MLEKERDLLKRDERPKTEGREEPEERRLTPMAQMDRLFDEVFKKPFFHLWSQRMAGEEMAELSPPVDIYEEGDSVVVKAEIPGIRKEDLDVRLSPESITISGQKSKEQRVERKDFYRLESSYGSFIRTCRLPVATLTDTAKASFRDGVLEIRILKKNEATADRGKKLTID